MTQFYIGLMSGTSADGIDLCLTRFEQGTPHLVADHFEPYSSTLRQAVISLYTPSSDEIDRAFSLDVALSKAYAVAIENFLNRLGIKADDIEAIGCHGQTVRHRPGIENPFTLQLGCAQTLASRTGIRVIADFRTKDMAFGGQGAPLVPAFHKAMFSECQTDVVVLNIGGIANLTYLPASNFDETSLANKKSIIGFDTGPGNALLDDWYSIHNDGNFDESGEWGASGEVIHSLLDEMLQFEYFSLSAPKSTGREVFNLPWLNAYKSIENYAPKDVQATLVSLTAISISDAINHYSQSGKLYICGGGLHNKILLNQLDKLTPHHKLLLTKEKNIDGDSVEAMAFSWFAYAFDKKIIGNIPAVTGASAEVVLGTSFDP